MPVMFSCRSIAAPVFVAAPVGPMVMVGRGLPAYSSSGTASAAVDSSYDTAWAPSSDPCYLAIDCSSVVGGLSADISGFKSMVLAWYTQNGIYQPNLHGDSNSNIPGSYTIDTNSAAGGSYPTTGWVIGTGANAVSGNLVQSRSHIVNMTGSNWLRFSLASQADSSTGGNSINVDLWDASHGQTNSAHTAVTGGWVFCGDSITHRTMMQDVVGQGGPAYTSPNALVYALTGYTPLQESCGIDGWKASDIAGQISTWLPLWTEKYVGLMIGTNDALGGTATSAYGASLTTILNAITGAGKIPVCPTLPYMSATGGTNIPGLNSTLASVLSGYPTAIYGSGAPDFYTLYLNGTIALDPDGIHPSNPAGCETARNTWANFMATIGGGA